ncbi:Uncharacterised protein [Weissella viridescens]|uniref:3-dehydroquinate synthase n=1 Tax=Weissella viridescens TaxID=1629 RepID=A0A380P2N3_WEIVI|nr:Uncharacterised protein [Weissella viridescens]
MIDVNVKEHPYQIDLENGGSNAIGTKVSQLWSPRKVIVISDMNVADIYLKAVVKNYAMLVLQLVLPLWHQVKHQRVLNSSRLL